MKEAQGIEDDEEGEENEEEEDNARKVENIFYAGRIYREDIELPSDPVPAPAEGEEPAKPEKKYKTKWIYERWNRIISTKDYPNMPARLGGLLKDSRQEVRSQKMRIKEAREAVARAAEEKKALLAAAAAKKAKAAKKGGKKQEEAPAEEEAKGNKTMTAQSDDGDLNLNDPKDFAKALSKEAPRPFTFGPIELGDLNPETATKAFDDEKNRKKVIESLDLHMQ